MSLRTFIRGLVSGTKSSGPIESTSIDSEDSSSESGNPSKAHSPESNDGPYRAARDVIYDFLPMFRKLNEQGTDYCVVGGMAVLLQAMDKARDSNRFRATHDADIMFGSEYTNVDFAKVYMAAFGEDGQFAKAAYDEMFGEGAFEELAEEDQALVNCSFCGPDTFSGKNDYPDFDVVRSLNGLALDDLDKEYIQVEDVAVPVAKVGTLLEMKRRTVALLKSDLAISSRPQDYADIETLEMIQERLNDQGTPERDYDGPLPETEDPEK